MSYTFISAHWGNAERTSVIATSREFGAVIVSQRDRPELWAQLMASSVEISVYPPDDATIIIPEAQTAPEYDNGSDSTKSPLVMLAHALAPDVTRDGPNLKVTPFRAGGLRGGIYDFAEIGTELPSHTHDEGNVHISVVAQGSVMSVIDGQPHTLRAGDVIAFQPGQEHNLVALEPLSRVVNIVYGR